MNQFYNSPGSQTIPGAVVQTDVKSFLLRVYNWMAMGLAITGLTAFAVSSSESMIELFLMNKMMFASVSVLGYITKMDLSKMGSFLFMALIGLIIASVVNMFLANSTLYWIISYAGVLIFVGLTAYDTQKIKQMAYNMEAGSETGKKGAIIGALTLYLDFINMFLFLLRILGNRR